jgi:mono/diheme cytochrome c family protein
MSDAISRKISVCMLCLATMLISACGGGSSSTGGPPAATTTIGGAGPPTVVKTHTPARHDSGKEVIARSGCLACHQIGANGNRTLASNLTHIGSRLSRNAILRSLRGGPNIMPSFESLGDRKLNEVADFLSQLK